jgi:hypothetical protein
MSKEEEARQILKEAFAKVKALGLSANMDFGCNIDSVNDVNEWNFKFRSRVERVTE